MNSYELTVVLPEKATIAKKKAVSETLEKVVKIAKGEIKKTDDLGKIDLAYPIKGNRSGVFMYFELELEPTEIKSLDQKMKLEEGIIRYLLVKKDK